MHAPHFKEQMRTDTLRAGETLLTLGQLRGGQAQRPHATWQIGGRPLAFWQLASVKRLLTWCITSVRGEVWLLVLVQAPHRSCPSSGRGPVATDAGWRAMPNTQVGSQSIYRWQVAGR